MPERARSFGAVAATSARPRPGCPAAALEWALAPAPGGEVLDLGAGTGKVTEALLRRPGLRVTAVDPDPAMLAQFRAALPLRRPLPRRRRPRGHRRADPAAGRRGGRRRRRHGVALVRPSPRRAR